MKVGLFSLGIGTGARPGVIAKLAEAAERYGVATLWVGEHVVRGVGLLEPFLGLAVAGVRIGVVLLGQLPVGALDVALGRVRRDAEHLVVVLLEPLARRLGHGRP